MTAIWAAIGALLGLAAGSFIATLVLRWPAGRSIAKDRSACDHCGIALRSRDLVPLLSFSLAHGRCRSCRQPIDRIHPIVEASAALVGAAAFAMAPGWDGVAGAVFGWSLLTLAALDYRHFWLPDRLTMSLAALGLGAGVAGIDPPLEARVIGALAGYLSLWAIGLGYARLRHREGLGGGDPKLLGAIGAWLGWAALPWVVLLAALGGLVAVAVRSALGHRFTTADRLPFGTALAAAAFVVWLATA